MLYGLSLAHTYLANTGVCAMPGVSFDGAVAAENWTFGSKGVLSDTEVVWCTARAVTGGMAATTAVNIGGHWGEYCTVIVILFFISKAAKASTLCFPTNE